MVILLTHHTLSYPHYFFLFIHATGWQSSKWYVKKATVHLGVIFIYYHYHVHYCTCQSTWFYLDVSWMDHCCFKTVMIWLFPYLYFIFSAVRFESVDMFKLYLSMYLINHQKSNDLYFLVQRELKLCVWRCGLLQYW